MPTPRPAEVPATTWAAEPAPGEIPAAESRPDRDVPHGASPAQLREAIARLAASERSHTITLDALSVVLKEAGFQRPPNSPRLVTRLRATPGVVVLPNGNVRLAGEPIAGAVPEEDAGRHQGRRGGRRRGGRGRKAPTSPST
jgi:hypothetical protein